MTSNTACLVLTPVEGGLPIQRGAHGDISIQPRMGPRPGCDISDTTSATECQPPLPSTAHVVVSNGMTLLGVSELKEMLTKVQQLEHSYSRLARNQRLSRAIQQIVQFCTKHAPSLDIITQVAGGHAQIVWGPLRALLTVCSKSAGEVMWIQLKRSQVAETSLARFLLIKTAVARIGDILSISEQFEALFASDTRVRDRLAGVYAEVHDFLQMLHGAVTKKGKINTYQRCGIFVFKYLTDCEAAWRRLFQSLASSVNEDFRENIDRLQSCMQNLRDDIQAAHMGRVEISQRGLRSCMSLSLRQSSKLITFVEHHEQEGSCELNML